MAKLTDTRAIVESGETFDGGIIPTVRSEIDRRITIESKGTVTDGVYGDEVEIEPDARVDASVMGSTAVELDSCAVFGDVGCAGRITGSDGYVHSSVSGTTIRLQDCVVRGNVVGTNVRLEGCLVLGIVAAETELTLEDSLCYTFKAFKSGECSNSQVMLPQAIVADSFTVADPIEVVGLAVTNDEDETTMRLDEDDRVEYDGTTYLTVADRVLDLDGIETRIETLEDMLRRVIDEGESRSTNELRETVAAALDVDVNRLP